MTIIFLITKSQQNIGSTPHFGSWEPKTTDFQLLQSMLIVPSLVRQLSSCERIFENDALCRGREERSSGLL